MSFLKGLLLKRPFYCKQRTLRSSGSPCARFSQQVTHHERCNEEKQQHHHDNEQCVSEQPSQLTHGVICDIRNRLVDARQNGRSFALERRDDGGALLGQSD
jgi:hypothetical protein